MSERSRIDATEVDSVVLSDDGTRLVLLLRDATGQKFALSVPVTCLNTLLRAMPRPAPMGARHALDAWSMDPAENGSGMVLTLRTPEGLAVSFTIKPWQVQGMATVATFGAPHDVPPRSIH
ncbi:MAG TPA: hypothetical protein VMU81_19150 [Acetobacteraceae bacterium]|nr:hypothetical protein [Acetobacteraceae bacterium]